MNEAYVIHYLFLFIAIIFTVWFIYQLNHVSESFEDYSNDTDYQKQVQLVTNMYNSTYTAKRSVNNYIISNTNAPTSFINYQMLGCRYSGYLGPFTEGYFDPDIAIQYAVKAGCRVFVIDIDYTIQCSKPRIAVRDIKGRLQMKQHSSFIACDASSIRLVCDKINFYAFADTCQQNTDPVVIVLYFKRIPDGAIDSDAVLNYYSDVAKCLIVFEDRLLGNELYGGKYYRQQQESELLIQPIQHLTGKVLVFSNADTSGFRNKNYPIHEDLDYRVNLRLSYSQTQLGVTKKDSTFGILQTAEDFTVIPPDLSNQTKQDTTTRWTICFPIDPSTNVSFDIFKKITQEFGVHCVPIIIFDDTNNYMFSDSLFKIYSFIPKPISLQYINPPLIVPSEPHPSLDANKGILLRPTIQ